MATLHDNSNSQLSHAFAEFRAGPVDKVTKLFWSINEDTLLKLALHHSHDGEYFLDLGCGSGGYCALLATRNRECTGVDPLWESSLENVVKNWGSDERFPEYIQASGEYLPLKAQRYDVILCISTLQHVNNQISTLHEIRRVAKPGATVIFSATQTFRKSTFNKLGLYTMHFNVKTLKKLLEETDFHIIKISGCGFFMPLTGKILNMVYPLLGEKRSHDLLLALDFFSDKIPSLASSIIIVTEAEK